MATVASTTRPRATGTPVQIARVLIGVVIGMVLVAGVIGFAADRWFYAVVLYSFLIGLAGGLFGWAMGDEWSPDLQQTWFIAVIGVLTTLVLFLMVQYLRYRLGVREFEVRPGWWSHLVTTAGETEFSRRAGQSTFVVPPAVAWGLRALDLTIALVTGGAIAKLMHVSPAERRSQRTR